MFYRLNVKLIKFAERMHDSISSNGGNLLAYLPTKFSMYINSNSWSMKAFEDYNI